MTIAATTCHLLIRQHMYVSPAILTRKKSCQIRIMISVSLRTVLMCECVLSMSAELLELLQAESHSRVGIPELLYQMPVHVKDAGSSGHDEIGLIQERLGNAHTPTTNLGFRNAVVVSNGNLDIIHPTHMSGVNAGGQPTGLMPPCTHGGATDLEKFNLDLKPTQLRELQ